MKTETFEKKTDLTAKAEDVFEWHSKDGAINRLSPPWAPLKIVSKTPGVDKGTRVNLKIKTGPVFSPWNAVHTECEQGRMFQDTQIKGPFRFWRHTHRFIPHDSGSTIKDTIEFALPFPFGLSRLANCFINKELNRIFTYRHKITERDLSLHLSGKIQRPLKIAITGASGLLGSHLVPFFRTGGHTVKTLVRRKPDSSLNEIFWDPEKGVLSPSDLEGTDVVIHLAGENIGDVKWTEDIKKRLTASRIKGTELISKTIAGLEKPPHVFLCASATGFYGDTGDKWIDESTEAGNQFISELCSKWEESCKSAVDKGIRTVNMRIGVVLSPLGGALSKVLPLFKSGMGFSVGNSRQYISWISVEDVLYAIHHLISTPGLEGPVNLVSPEPVTNLEYTKKLAGILKRPSLFRLPEKLIRTVFAQMGEEILLSGSRVKPAKLLDSGFTFNHPDITSALKETLGAQ